MPAPARRAELDLEVRRAGRRAEAGDVDAVRGAEEQVVAVGELRRALLEHGEDRAAVVVDDDDRQVGTCLARAEDQPGHVVQERHVAHQRERARACRGGPARHRWRSRRCRRCRPGRGWRSPCGGRRRRTRATIRSRSRIGLDAPTKSSPPSGSSSADGTGDFVRRQVGLVPQQRVQLTADGAVGCLPRGQPRGIVGGRVDARSTSWLTGKGRSDQQPGERDRDDLDVVARQQPGHRPRQRRVADHDDALDPVAEVAAEQHAIGPDRVVAGARAAGGLGEQRPVRALGERPGRRAGVVAGDDDGARAGLQRRRPRRPATTSSSRVAVPESAQASSGTQRVIELDVEVDRSAGRRTRRHRRR